jgi:hypothetical protein
MQISNRPTTEVSRVYVVDMAHLPTKTFESVRDHLRNNPGAVLTIEVEKDVDLASHMKRLHIVLSRPDLS